MTIAQELERRLWTLADPQVRWVQGHPIGDGEACLVWDGEVGAGPVLSPQCVEWLSRFLTPYVAPDADALYYFSATHFNDSIAADRRDVLLMLEEAVDQARWEGV